MVVILLQHLLHFRVYDRVGAQSFQLDAEGELFGMDVMHQLLDSEEIGFIVYFLIDGNGDKDTIRIDMLDCAADISSYGQFFPIPTWINARMPFMSYP